MKAMLTLLAVLAALAVAAPLAAARNPEGGSRFITDTLGGNGGTTQPQDYRFITDTLGGNGGTTQPQDYRFITDTLGGNGSPPAGLDPGIQAAINAHTASAGLDPGIQAAMSTPNAAPRSATSDAMSRYLGNHAQPLVGPQVSANGSGFDWADAGIGAAGMLGIMLLASAAAFVMRQGRRRPASA